MEKYKTLKLLSLIIMSISLPLFILLAVIGVTEIKYDIMQKSHTNTEFALMANDFYNSNIFEENTIASLSYRLKSSVDSEFSKAIKVKMLEAYYADQENEGTNIAVNSPNYNYASITKSDAIKYLASLKNVKFYVRNTITSEYYTNEKYESLSEFKKNIKGYCNVEIASNAEESLYTKVMDGKKTKLNGISMKLNGVDESFEGYISFPKEPTMEDGLVYTNFQIFEQATKKVQSFFVASLSLAIICILSIIVSRIIKCSALKKNNIFLIIYNKIPMEFNILLASLAIALLTMYTFYTSTDIYIIILVFMALLVISNNIFFIIVQLRSLENKLYIFKTSIIVRLIIWIVETIKEVINATKKISLARRIIGIVIVCLIIIVLIGIQSTSMGLLISIGAFIGFALYITKRLSYLSYVIDGTEKIKEGELDYKIKINGNDNFTSLAENINNIGEGLDKAIEEQVKSERMKSDLITNVSHDLKTPLTSIINYVDLIKKEDNIQPEYINEYISVLESKSKRLKLLIEDLFEASRASSGNIELQMSKIDLIQLLRQSIGELEEKLSKNNLYIKLNVPNNKVYILADGRRMYRVLENLLSNIAKYSLEGTRVYIDINEDEENVKVIMKNISSYELNFDPSEIMERFKRADESRNTEGSGLGLAIARDLVNLQGGKFYIDIDGDLFKANLEFNKYELTEEMEDE